MPDNTSKYQPVSKNRDTYRYTIPGLYIYLKTIGGIAMQRREKGMGTIVQRESGTWSGRVSIGRGTDGKVKYKYFFGKTEAEVKRKIREYNKAGCPQDASQILFKDYLMSWLVNIKKISLKPSSYDRLESTALKQVIPRLGGFKISEITPEDIGKMMSQIKDEGLSYSTTKKAFDCVNAVMSYAFNKRDIPVNPALLSVKPNESNFQKKEIRYFTKEEAALITEECRRLYNTGTPVYPYGDAFILALHTGLRMGELIGLQKGDIDFANKKLTVRRNAQVVGKRNPDGSRAGGRVTVLSTTKTYSGTRMISLNSTALEAAKRLCDGHPESQNVVCGVRGTQVSHERFERSFYRILDNCGIERTGVHSLRHTFASMLFDQGVDIKTISTLLGHASVKITMDTYVHLIRDTGKYAVETLDSI